MRKAVLILLLFLAGCGYRTQMDYAPQAVKIAPQAQASRVLILPLSDLRGIPYRSWLQYNLTIYEALSQAFISYGYLPVPYENVLAYLKENRYLTRKRQKIKISPSLLELYQEDWSPIMKEELERVIGQEISKQQATGADQPLVLPLKREDMKKLARAFGSELVIRGRILELGIRQSDSLDPFQIGFLTATNRTLARFFYGRGRGAYGTWQEVSVGGLIFGIAGSNAHDPFEPPHRKVIHAGHPLLGETYTAYRGGNEDYDFNNFLVWGAAGAALSFLATQGGDNPEAVVALSLDIYDPARDEIIWHNRVRLRVAPVSFWASAQPTDLMLAGVEAAARSLIKRFFADLYPERYAAATKTSPTSP